MNEGHRGYNLIYFQSTATNKYLCVTHVVELKRKVCTCVYKPVPAQ